MKPTASCRVSYPPLRGIVQLPNSTALRFWNWSFTNKYLIDVDIRPFLYYEAPDKNEYSPVAQSVERLAVNQHVRGSSPRWGAILAEKPFGN